jgi:gamma-glutamylcysteine synthetase
LVEQAKLVGMTMDDIADVYDFVNEIKEVMDEQDDEESDIWPEEYPDGYNT